MDEVKRELKPPQGRCRVLVVDDEPLIGQVIRRTLGRDFDVTVTGGVAQALAQVQAGATFDVVLCDLMMPEQGGMDLYAAFQRLGLDTRRIIFMSGGAFTAEARTFLEQVGSARVEKPFEIDELRKLVFAVAAGEPPGDVARGPLP